MKNFKKECWVMFFAVVFFGLFGPSNLDYFWYLYLMLFVGSLIWTLYLIYVCERYIVHMATFLTAVICIFAYSASSLAYVSMSTVFGKSNVLTIVGGMSPLVLVCIVFVVVFRSKSSFFPFEVIGNRVISKKKELSGKNYSVGFVAGVSTFTGGLFIKSIDEITRDVVSIAGGTGISIVMLLFLRHSIRGLRTLRIQERLMPIPYTFMQIEEIREARSRWWLGRFFKWITSLFDSPVPK